MKRVTTVDAQEVEDLPDSKLSQDVNEIIKKYEDVFHRIRCLQGSYNIKFDPSITPVVHPYRKIPFTQRDKVKEELDRMEQLGDICKADRMG